MRRLLILLISSLFTLAGCSNPKYTASVSPLADFARYETFYCADCLEGIDHRMPRYDNEEIRRLIRDALISEMESRNYEMQETYPDLLVELVIVIKNKIDTVAQRTTDYRYWQGFQTDFYNYKVGSIFINIIERKKGEIVWQGRADSVLEQYPKNLKNRIEQIVEKIFKKYPYFAKQ
ncbi:MAG: DUF4136 domain-containing protein [Bacteroidetes bacterium]|nr:DUF4136 domain-containing protein [Bacteroidota bacterium]